MFGSRHKLTVFAALSGSPDFRGLSSLKRLSTGDGSRFLTWLDRSGLSLYFLERLKEHGAQGELPAAMLEALGGRLALSRARSEEWRRDFQTIVELLDQHGVPYVALKGLTLVPEFCPRFALRHQADIDLWLEPSRVADAQSALATRGFVARSISWDAAVSLAGPGDERVSMNESIYRPGRARRLELHVTLVEHTGPAAIRYPAGQWERATRRDFSDVSCRALSRADMFVYQVFHAFRHIMESWIRPSWLYEIAYFLNRNEGDDPFWQNVCRSMGEDAQLRDGIGLVLDLTRRMFHCKIPAHLSQACLDHLPSRIALWNAHFGQQFVLTGPSRNKVSLFVQKGFIRDSAARQSYIRRNLLPITSKPALSEIRGKALTQSLSDRWNKLSFLRSKLAYHLKYLAVYPYHSLRWHLIQRSHQRP